MNTYTQELIEGVWYQETPCYEKQHYEGPLEIGYGGCNYERFYEETKDDDWMHWLNNLKNLFNMK